MLPGIVMAEENKIDCDVEFGKILNQGDSFDIKGKIQQLEEKLSKTCKGTGSYEVLLWALRGKFRKGIAAPHRKMQRGQ